MATHPAPSFEHLLRLTDDTGIFEHARYLIPRREHGYTTDDVARALIAVCREPDPAPNLVRAATVYFAFLEHARRPDGRFHNRLSFDRRWLDVVGSEDSEGRAIWALGTCAHLAPVAPLRQASLTALLEAPLPSWRSPRSNAFGALGVVEALHVFPDEPRLRASLARYARGVPRPGTGSWPWPEERLTYANGVLPEALVAAGTALDDSGMVNDGLRLLAWLVEVESSDKHFSFTPVGGWQRGEPRPGFDQQPVEAEAIAGAAMRAWEATGDQRWLGEVHRAADWLLGANDTHTALYDPDTGAGHDGLTPQGINLNSGAESTIAAILVLQHARRARSEQASKKPRLVDRGRPHGHIGSAVGEVDGAVIKTVGALDEHNVGDVALDLPGELRREDRLRKHANNPSRSGIEQRHVDRVYTLQAPLVEEEDEPGLGLDGRSAGTYPDGAG